MSIQMKNSFEKELKQKLNQKVKNNQSEGTLLLNSFKFVDLSNNGFANKEQFLRSIGRIGLTGFSEMDLAFIFEEYDTQRKGFIDYKNFVSNLFKVTNMNHNNSNINSDQNTNTRMNFCFNNNYDVRNIDKNNSNLDKSQNLGKIQNLNEMIISHSSNQINTITNNNRNFTSNSNLEEIFNKIRAKLFTMGLKGIMGLLNAFKIMSKNNVNNLGNNLVNIYDFQKALKDYVLELNSNEIFTILKIFDKNNSKCLDFLEFIKIVRGNMSIHRKNILENIFKSLDRNKVGYLKLEDLKRNFDPTNHPDVVFFKKNLEDVWLEFFNNFESFHQIYSSIENNNNNLNQKVTQQEFLEFYENLSFCLNDDTYFANLVNNSWKVYFITNSNLQNIFNNSGSNINNNALSQNNLNTILTKLRTTLTKRGAKGFSDLQKQFKIFDDDKSRKINFEEFLNTITQFNVPINQNETKQIFDSFDHDRTGEIDYDEFIKGVRGPMNKFRKNLVLKAFTKLDKNMDGVLDVDDIKSLYNTKDHPDFKYNRKSEKEILEEFLNNFKLQYNIKNNSQKDGLISIDEFLEYYDNISASIDNDEYFELMMNNSWKLNESSNRNRNVKENNFNPINGEGINIGTNLNKISNNLQVSTNFNNSNLNVINKPEKSNSRSPNTNNNLKQTNYLSPLESLKKFRQKIAARGTKGIYSMQRMFKICDNNRTGTLDVEEISGLIKDYRISLTDEEIKQVFSFFDRNENGIVDYDEFLRVVIGEMNDFRKNIVKRAFAKLDKNLNGSIETQDIKGLYNASRHPDVIAGKRTEDDILAEWLDNFDQYSYLKGKDKRDHLVNFEEFTEYYNNVSMSIDDDRYFDLMMNNCWNLDGNRNLSNVGGTIIKKNVVQNKFY